MSNYTNYFSVNCHVRDLLFKGITVSSPGAMVGLCIGVAVFTTLYESTKSLNHYLVITLVNRGYSNSVAAVDNSDERSSRKFRFFKSAHFSRKALQRLFHVVQTLVHMLQLTMGYMVMLIVMSYNVWLLLTVIFTTAVNYYLQSHLMHKKPLVVPVDTQVSNL